MDPDELIRRHPRLFHMAEPGSWQGVRQHGLLSTTALLDLYEVSPGDRHMIESEIRPESVRIEHAIHGKAVIRDNKPLRKQFLKPCLDDMTIGEWCELLNRHVFFWPTEERLMTLLSARAYRKYMHDVITVDTAGLVGRHAARIRLADMNTGSTLYPNAPVRGRNTFRTIQDFPPRGRAVVEVAVETAVLDITDLIVTVERRKGQEIIETLYRR